MSNKIEALQELLAIVHPILHNRCIAIPTRSIEVRVEMDGEDYILRIDGFYKHGSVTLKMVRDSSGINMLRVDGRYGKIDEFYNPLFSDLVSVNYNAYLNFKDRGFEVDKAWAPYLVEAGYLTIETQAVYKEAR